MPAGQTSSGAATKQFPREVLVVWLLFGVVALEILVTYSRLPPTELYHVSGTGLAAGASRVLVFLNFPTALVALAILGLLYDALPGRSARAAAVVAAALCAAVFWPGVVSQADLDARPVNAIAAEGVALALLLTFVAGRRARFGALGRVRGDRARVLLGAALAIIALPWLAADLGLFLDRVPVAGNLFQTGHEARPAVVSLPAVHHGHHHGADGLLLALSALLLSRALERSPRTRLRFAVGAYLALMLCYGIGNIANDFWTEQVVKRGWTNWAIPNVLEPRPTTVWGLIILASSLVFAIWWRRGTDLPRAG